MLDADRIAAQKKIGDVENAVAVELHAENEEERNAFVKSADIVISLLKRRFTSIFPFIALLKRNLQQTSETIVNPELLATNDYNQPYWK